MGPKIVLINSSPKKDGNTYYLLDKFREAVEKNGGEAEILHLNSALLKLSLPFCICCSSPCNQSCYKGTEFEKIMNTVREADGVVFGSPVYFGSMSAQMKAFFDKCRNTRAEKGLLGKVGCALSVGATKYGGQENTVRAIHDCMLVMGMNIIGDSSTIYGSGHFGVCAHQPAPNDDYAKKRIEALAERLVAEAMKNSVSEI